MNSSDLGTTLALIGLLLSGALVLRVIALRRVDLEDLPSVYRRRVDVRTALSRPLAVLAGALCLLGLGMSLLE